MNIEIVNIVYVDAIWETVGPKFQRAIDKCGDDLATGELWQMCRSGNAFLVIARDEETILMGAVVRFDRWTDGVVLRVTGLAGERINEWAHQVKDFLAVMAKENGADRIVAEGRDGWAAIFDEPRKLRSTYEMRV